MVLDGKKMENKEKDVVHPLSLIQKAVEAGSSIETIEKLMLLNSETEKNEAKKAFNIAITKFQKLKPDLVKSKSVEYEKNNVRRKAYDFLPLPEMQQKIDPVLSEVGLSYAWKQEGDDKGNIKIICVVRHVGGHSEETELSSTSDNSGGKNTIQAIGSAVSYLKRYTLKNALGLSEADDDGQGTSLTEKEMIEAKETVIVDLYTKNDEKIPEREKTRIDEILAKKEVESYDRVLKRLRYYENENKN